MLMSLIIILGFALTGITFWNSTPFLKVFLIKKAFNSGTFVPSPFYEIALEKTNNIQDINYKSKFPSGNLDLIFPKNTNGKTPIIFWVHGGGFVGGDKSDITGYGIELAAQGYSVVNINYALAPKRKYPTPILQLGEAYKYIKENATKFNLDLNRVYFAGDSAGAQISSQFVNIQTSEKYAKLTKINAVVEPNTIKGVLLFCGPYNMPDLAKIESSREIQDFLRTTGWAYLGQKNWEESSEVRIASILNHVTNKYPRTFITDGNTGSFEDQGKALVSALQNKGVAVTSLFFDKNVSGKLAHEFQFKMNTRAGRETFSKVLEFLSKSQ
ncbi:acetylesterase [Bacillus thuringiensis serovar londrina]|uniref:Acetyl esterase n=1 Tax=Bacillus thuringiensis TaxID=1428 RepID=A0A1B2RCA7_BACTU|nr:alpha/beta hydrolase [Bacillus thuringiensis]AOB42295.1 acetyl esterase [Bacillus thuringiensis]OMH25224.1 acetylesterase [Bacillus thuringiensis]OTX80732.1 acetylesterase [Bacillus thuringiensis serovar londrina]